MPVQTCPAVHSVPALPAVTPQPAVAPQKSGLLFGSTQVPWQSTRPAAQLSAHTPALHT